MGGAWAAGDRALCQGPRDQLSSGGGLGLDLGLLDDLLDDLLGHVLGLGSLGVLRLLHLDASGLPRGPVPGDQGPQRHSAET